MESLSTSNKEDIEMETNKNGTVKDAVISALDVNGDGKLDLDDVKTAGAKVANAANDVKWFAVGVADAAGEKINAAVNKIKTKQKNKKEMNFQTVDSMQQVVNVVNEAAEAVNNKDRTISTSSIPGVLSGVAATLGAGVGGAASFGLLYGLGTVGLSAAGITSGLAAAGGLIGGGMVAGFFVLAAPVVALASGGVFAVNALKSKQVCQERERLYKETIQKHEAIIETLKEELDATQERLDYLESLNILLQQAIKDLKEDIDLAEAA